MDRRQFIKRSSQAVIGLFLSGSVGRLLAAASPAGIRRIPRKILDFTVSPSSTLPQMVIAQGGTPGEMARRAIGAIGGMGRFISKGDRVVLKPNASWDRSPQQAADTNPEIVAVLTELSLKAGARQVIAIDHTIGEPGRCLARSGIGPAVVKAGGSIRHQNARAFRDAEIGGAVGKWPVFKPLFEADKFINIPVVKQHSLSTLTAGMKNLYGIIGEKRSTLHPKIDESIVELANFARPTLIVLDAFSVMVKNGPSGGSLSDLVHPHVVAAGTDPVALDAFAATLIGVRPESVGHVALAHKRGLGEINYKKLRVKEV
jgi:uncharacterized protein (DUF362 family)